MKDFPRYPEVGCCVTGKKKKKKKKVALELRGGRGWKNFEEHDRIQISLSILLVEIKKLMLGRG